MVTIYLKLHATNKNDKAATSLLLPLRAELTAYLEESRVWRKNPECGTINQ